MGAARACRTTWATFLLVLGAACGRPPEFATDREVASALGAIDAASKPGEAAAIAWPLLLRMGAPSGIDEEETAEDTVKEFTLMGLDHRDAALLQVVAHAPLEGEAADRQCRAVADLLWVAPQTVEADLALQRAIVGECDFIAFEGFGKQRLQWALARGCTGDDDCHGQGLCAGSGPTASLAPGTYGGCVALTNACVSFEDAATVAAVRRCGAGWAIVAAPERGCFRSHRDAKVSAVLVWTAARPPDPRQK